MQKLAGQMSLDYVMKSIELGKAGLIDVVSTAPIHKEAIKLAGCKLRAIPKSIRWKPNLITV
nr:4-hydroxythreonine-4-phosphate dehydrogenase [Klebsiella pneumoniae]